VKVVVIESLSNLPNVHARGNGTIANQ
jgi:hypothetical protein